MPYFIFSRSKGSHVHTADRTADHLIDAQQAARELRRDVGPQQGATVDIVNSDTEILARWTVNRSGNWVRS